MIAAEQRLFLAQREAEMVGRMARRRHRLQRPARPTDLLAVGQHAVGPVFGIERRIGARPVAYTRLLYGDDAATARAPGEATGAWWFADASFALTLGFSADGPTVDVSAEPAPIGVVKPRNDAACDDVQVRADASFAGGLHAASPDTVYAEIDYAAAAAGALSLAPAAPTLLVDDAVFTACVDEHALGPIGSTAELRAELDGMVAREELCGLRGPPVPFTIGCAVAGEARAPIALALTPQIFLHSTL